MTQATSILSLNLVKMNKGIGDISLRYCKNAVAFIATVSFTAYVSVTIGQIFIKHGASVGNKVQLIASKFIKSVFMKF